MFPNSPPDLPNLHPLADVRRGELQHPDYSDVAVPEESHLLDYIRVLYRRRWIAAAVFVTVVAIGALRTFTSTPIYEATAQVLIETAERNVLTFKDVVALDQTGAEYAQTQHRLLRSRALARKTLDALNLWDRPPVSGTRASDASSSRWVLNAIGSWSPRLFNSGPVVTTLPDETTAESTAIDRFVNSVIVSPVRNSQLVDVKFQSPDPQLAARATNELVRQYIAQNQQLKSQASKEASTWLTQQLEEQRRHVEASELALQKYREDHDAVSLADRQNIVIQKLADLNAAVTKAKTDRIQKEAEYNELRSIGGGLDGLDSFPAILANSYIQSLKSELTRLETQRVQLGDKFGERHPEMIKVMSAVRTAREKLDAELGKVVRSVHSEYLSAQAEEKSLTAALNAQKIDAQAQNRKGIDYGALERDASTNRQLYEGLLQRVKETGVSGELKPSNVRVVDAAEVPRLPVLPRHRSNLLFAMFGGTLLAVSAAFFVERLDNRIKSPEEISGHLGMPCLGLVPMVSDKVHSAAPLINNGVPANFAEAFKGVRTNVLFSSAAESSRSLVVTSTGPGEGKTIVSTNLAMALAQAGQRVILIDADMRRPQVHEMLGQKQEPGLSNLIVGSSRASETVRPSSVPGLWVLPAGRIPPNPAELLGSARFRDFLVTLRDHFDWVVIDSPPAMAVTDAAVIAHIANGVLFVVGAEMAPRGAARTAVSQLIAGDGKFIGAVLNKVDLQRNGYYYSNYYRREYDSYHVAS